MAASGGYRGPRIGSVAFQQYMLAYLGSGDRALIARFSRGDGSSGATADAIEAWPIVAQAGRFAVRAPQP